MRERRSNHGQGAGTKKVNSVEDREFHGSKFFRVLKEFCNSAQHWMGGQEKKRVRGKILGGKM
jgi:hypothetical protein